MARFKIVMLLPLALLLGGCPGNPKIKASPTFVCVELKQYSRAEQNRMADELEAYADKVPAIAAAIDDYGSLRAAIRAKCGRKNPG